MEDIAIKEVLGKLPKQELETSMETYLKPMIEQIPDKRLQGVIPLAVQGILGSESPVVTQMAQTVARLVELSFQLRPENAALDCRETGHCVDLQDLVQLPEIDGDHRPSAGRGLYTSHHGGSTAKGDDDPILFPGQFENSRDLCFGLRIDDHVGRLRNRAATDPDQVAVRFAEGVDRPSVGMGRYVRGSNSVLEDRFLSICKATRRNAYGVDGV